MSTINVAAGVAGCCVRICFEITELLVVAKHNKEECRSLHTAVTCIQTFVERIPGDSVSAVAGKVFEALLDALNHAKSLITRVTNTGPLVSLLTASVVREEFLRINRDLTSTFQILASGENLLNLASSRSQLTDVQRQLSKTKSFFLKQEQKGERLRDVAAVAAEQHTPDELLHRALLDQLEQYSEVAQLTPQQLLEELQALQMAAMYGAEHGASGKGKTLGTQTEEFLMQQLCAALSPKAAAAGPLTPSAAADIPDGYSCPISQEIMSNPVILVETGQSYEAANIHRWLAAHSTCPATGKKLSSKQTVPNYNLKKSIHGWASQHGVALPSGAATSSSAAAASSHVSLLVDDQRSNSLRAPVGATFRSSSSTAAAAVKPPPGYPAVTSKLLDADTVASAAAAEGDSRSLLAAAASADADRPKDSSGLLPLSMPCESKPLKSSALFRCTRTLWAAGFIVLALAAAVGVGSGVGIYLTRRPGTAQDTVAANASSTNASLTGSPAPQPAASSVSAGNTTQLASSPAVVTADSTSPAAATTVSSVTLERAADGWNVTSSSGAADTSSPSPGSQCPPSETVEVTGATDRGSVWGSDPYTLQSDWGVAAVHAGLIEEGQNATVLLKPAGYIGGYEGTTRNGATTSGWSSPWCGVTLELVNNSTG